MIKSLIAAMLLLAVPFAAAGAAPIRIVALGDSLTAGYGLGPDDGFTVQLQKALKAKGLDVVVENAGVSGDTAEGGLDRLDWSVGETADAVIVELGANDMLRGLDPAMTKTALSQILERLAARKLPVLIAGMQAAPNLGPDYKARFDAIYPDLAKRYGAMLYPFFLEGVAARQDYLQPDGLHPNPAGVAIIVESILPSVERLVAAARR